MEETLCIGLKGSAEVAVCPANTALEMGSGDMPVFATPALAALVEKAACNAIAGRLDGDETTVGTLLALEHVSATPVGIEVRCTAELVSLEGRKLVFSAEAFDSSGLIGRAKHERITVKRERFMQKASAKRGV